MNTFFAQQLTESIASNTSELFVVAILMAIGLACAFFVIRWMISAGKSPKYAPGEISQQLAEPINPNAYDREIAEVLEERTKLFNRTLIQFLPVPLVFFLIIFFTKEFLTYFAVIAYSALGDGSSANQTMPFMDPAMLSFQYFAHVGFSILIGFGGIFMIKKFTGFPAFKAFFMGRENKLKDILATIGILALSVAWIYFVIGVIWKLLLQGFGYEIQEQIQIQSLREHGTTLLWVGTTLAVVVGAPIIEEILFRGFLYQFLRKYQSAMFAAITQGFIFSVMHMSLSAFLPLWLLGVILALIVEKYKSLLPAMIAHAIFNSITIIFLILNTLSQNN